MARDGSVSFYTDQLRPVFTDNQKIRAIGSNEENFVMLSENSEIYLLGEGRLHKIEAKVEFSNKCRLEKVCLGRDFGHAIDLFGNLYGWGSNKQQELGIGDWYPRPKLTQIRIYDNNHQYLQCSKIVSMNNVCFGLFRLDSQNLWTAN